LLTTVGDVDVHVKERFAQARERGLPPWWTVPVTSEEYLDRFISLLGRGAKIVTGLGAARAATAGVSATLSAGRAFAATLEAS